MRSLRGTNVVDVLQQLIAVIRGWAALLQDGGVQRDVLGVGPIPAETHLQVDQTGATRRKTNPTQIVNRYFARFNRSRNDRLVFGDRDSDAYLVKHSWTGIVRHQMVKAGSSPDDPALAEYWANRRRRAPSPPIDNLSLRLLQAQRGLCPLCGEFLLAAEHLPQSPQEWEQRVRATGKALTKRPVARQERGSPDGHTQSPPDSCPLPQAASHRQGGSRPSTAATPASHWAYLSRMRGQRAGDGSQGAPAQQCAGATRRAARQLRQRRGRVGAGR
jgi:RNA-directed DNA polymerase